MKAPLSWLKDYTDIDLSPEQIAETLTHLGLEVEEVTGVYKEVPGIIIAKVVQNGRHPNADKLSVNKVDIGGGELLDVVCGAPNCRAGLTVALIQAGYKLPDGMEIKKSKIRGEASCGMLCSERELGLTEEADGILELPDTLPIGETLTAAHLGCDPVFTVAILPNRPDGLSVTGLAREIAAKTGKPFRLPAVNVVEGTTPVSGSVKVSITDAEGCPRYSARVIRQVKIGPSPEWLVKRLRACGVRSINNVVDITNFVMLELGQPMHAFDFAKIAGQEIIVRRAKADETMVTLDGAERKLLVSDLLICDKEKAVALAGVMGGVTSEVSDTTIDILLESAYFDPISIRKTSRRLGLISESSYRFERGVDPLGVIAALDRAASLLTELAGGVVEQGVIDIHPGAIQAKKIKVRVARINILLGTAFTEQEMKQALTSIGIECGNGAEFEAVIPTRRPDIEREEDIVEEVARLLGYDRVPVNARVNIAMSVAPNEKDLFRDTVRDYFAGFGMTEMVTNSLSHPAEVALVGSKEIAPALLNALSPEMSVLRTSMLPSLLKVVQWNKSRRTEDLSIFELGRVFASQGATVQPKETEIIAGICCGLSEPRRWDGKAREWDLYSVRGLLEAVVPRLTGTSIRFETVDGDDGLQIRVGGSVAGRLTVLSGGLLKKFDFKGTVYYFELLFEELYGVRKVIRKYRPVSKFPPSDRDLAVLTETAISSVDMVETIRKESPLIEDAVVFDVFQGGALGEGRKSTAFAIRFRKADATLTDQEIDEIMKRILEKLQKKFNAQIR